MKGFFSVSESLILFDDGRIPELSGDISSVCAPQAEALVVISVAEFDVAAECPGAISVEVVRT